jgi:integrase
VSKAHRVRTRADGTVEWRAVIYDDGQQSSRSFTVPSNSQRDADREADRVRAELRAARAAANAAKPARRDPGTIGRLAQDWMAHQHRHGSPSAVKGYRGIVRAIDTQFGDTPVDELTRQHIRAWYDQLTDRGMTPATLGHYHAVLRGMLSMAVERDHVKANVASAMKLGAGPRPVVKLPKDAALVKVLNSLTGDIAVASRLAAACGLRRGELCALRWSAIQGRTVHVRAAFAEGVGGVVLKSTKTGRERTVALDAATMRMLAAHRRAQRAYVAAQGGRLRGDWYVLADLDDLSGQTAHTPSWLSHEWQRHRGRLTIGLHGLRHWYASKVLESGAASIAELSAWLGHAQVSTTLNLYVHANPERARVSAQIMGPLLAPQRKAT